MPDTYGGAQIAFDWDSRYGVYTDTAATVSAGNRARVGAWVDRVSGLSFSQSTTANQPQLQTDAKGRPVIRLTNNLKATCAYSSVFTPLSNAFTVFFVIRNYTDDSGSLLFFGNGGSSSIGWSIFTDTTAGFVCRLYDGTTKASRSFPFTNTIGTSDVTVLTMQMTGSQIRAFMNGSEVGWTNGGGGATGATYSAAIDSTTTLALGSTAAGGTAYCGADIYRLAAYTGALSASDAATISQQLVRAYTVPQYVEPPAAISNLTGAVTLWTSGTDWYRIPAIAYDGTTIIAACEHRYGSSADSGHLEIEIRRSTDGGATWSAAAVVAGDGTNCFRNATLVPDPARGKWHLFYCNQPAVSTETGIIAATYSPPTIYYKSSTDGGVNWSAATDISASVRPASGWTWYATGPGRGAVTSSGRIVVPCDHYNSNGYYNHCIISDDGGTTFSYTREQGLVGGNEASIAIGTDGRLVMQSRNASNVDTFMFLNYSPTGSVWSSSARRLDMFQSGTQGGLATINGKLVRSSIRSWERYNLHIESSADNGASWTQMSRVYSGGTSYSGISEFSGTTGIIIWEKDGFATIQFNKFTVL